MKNKILLFVLIFGILPNIVSAFLISDQGTNVLEIATGNLTALANLTISIYDSSTGGNLIFEQNSSNAIVNGSWNVMINPNLEYGKSYWKDYQINGEDLDFDGNERLELQSSIGKINNISFINFSLINSCSEGSSIRLIYENGSVLCETDDSGSVNLTNYALKNQSEIFTGNITTTQTGFFGWLGSLSSRITKLFVQDVDASGNINVSGNVTAQYFKGDGSLLTGISTSSTNDTIWNITTSNYLYNNSGVLSVNETKLNNTIDSRAAAYNETPLISNVNTSLSSRIDGISGGNSSWNQSLADSLYSSKTWNYNQTAPAQTYTDTVVTANNASWSSTYNATYAASVANNTFNQSLTDTLYSSKTWNYNQTTPANAYTDTQISNNNASWSSTYNATYAANIGNASWNETYAHTLFDSTYNSTYGTWAYNQTYSGSTYNATYAANIGNASWNESYAHTLFDSTYNSTYATWAYNQTYSGSTYNSTYATWAYNQTYSGSTYNATYAANIGNASWNETYAHTLFDSTYNSTYATWAYNQTYSGSTYNSTYANILNQNCPAGQVVNGTLANGTFICTTPAGSMDYTNIALTNTSETWDAGQNISMGVGGWFKGLFNWTVLNNWLGFDGTTLSFNETRLNNTISSEGVRLGFNSTYNSTYAGLINNESYLSTYNATYAANVGNASWNESYAHTLFDSTYNSTYATWAYNQTAPANTYTDTKVGTADLHLHNALNITSPLWVNKTGDTMTGNLNMSVKNVTTVDCIVFASGGKICSA